MQPDRHGRHTRGVPDRRRRPVDGYRLPSTRRFTELVRDVVATLPPPVLHALLDARLAVEHVPPPGTTPVDGLLPLVEVHGAHGRASRVVVYRRPLEARAVNRIDLTDLLGEALIVESVRALELDLGGWDLG